MTPVTVPSDKHFLRAHVRPARRHPRWRLAARIVRGAVLLAVVAVGVDRAAAAVMRSGALRVESITVRGIRRLSRADVLATLAGLRGQNILRVDLDRARRRLLESPWVADAVLRKRLPASIDVVVTERHPIGIARLPGDRLVLVDEDGVAIDDFGPKYAELDLPIIDGLTSADRPRIDPQRADLAGRVLASLAGRQDLARRISQIDVSDAGDAVLLLDTDTALLRLGDRDFRQRLEGYVEMAPALRARVAAIDYVDLRYGSHVFVGTGDAGARTGRR